MVSALNKLKSREDSFFVSEKVDEANFSMLSSINEGTLHIMHKKEIES
jgi:hypothetical protein